MLLLNFNSASCFPQRCQACKASAIEGPIATFDCVRKCGICALCDGNPNSYKVPECDRYVKIVVQNFTTRWRLLKSQWIFCFCPTLLRLSAELEV